MNKKIIAVLLALLAYPGAGHFYLGLKKRGTFFAAAFSLVFLALFFILQRAVMNQINTLTDLTQIMGSIHQSMKDTWEVDSSFYISGFLLSLLIWIGSAVDILRLKKS